MLELIERLEKAEGPDRELDAEIWMTLHPEWRTYPRDDRENQPGWTTPNDGRAWCQHYTGSIDDALMLVPDGWAWFAQWIGKPFSEGSARLWIPSQRTQNLKVENIQVEARTPALALCIAVIKARTHGELENR